MLSAYKSLQSSEHLIPINVQLSDLQEPFKHRTFVKADSVCLCRFKTACLSCICIPSSKKYSICSFNEVISLGPYYFIIKSELITPDLDFKMNGSIVELYKDSFFRRRDTRVTWYQLAKMYWTGVSSASSTVPRKYQLSHTSQY